MKLNFNIVKNILFKISQFFRYNFKLIAIICILLLLGFLFYQGYSYYKVNQIHKNSIVFFDSKNINNEEKFYEIMQNLSEKKDIYATLSSLELIKLNLKNKNYNIALELYLDLLNNDKLENQYKAAIASKAAFEFIEIQFNNLSLDLIPQIEKFISFIDDNLNGYEGIKLELTYILAVAKVDKNNLLYNSVEKVKDLHNKIMENENISSAIKERVNKIHEFHLYK